MKSYLKMLPYILLGNALIAFSVCAFVVPHNLMLGGSTGIALTIQHWLPLRLSVISGATNLLLFLLGYFFLGKQFAASSLLSTLIYPLILSLLERLPLADLFNGDILVCSIFSGLLMGAGIGLVVRAGGSTGGMDIPPCILQKYKGIPVGTSLMVFDVLILLMQILFQGFDGILYSLTCIGLTSLTVDRLIVSGERKLQLVIISPDYRRIQQEILTTLDSGVTLLDIETGYSGEAQKALFTVVYAKKYPAIKEAALRIDSHAFIIASDVIGVNGRGYTLGRSESAL